MADNLRTIIFENERIHQINEILVEFTEMNGCVGHVETKNCENDLQMILLLFRVLVDFH